MNRSAEDMIALLTETIIGNFNTNANTKVLKTDLSKAYDTINIDHLLYKLEFYYGIKGNFIKFLKNFLYSREVRVKIKNYKTSFVKQKVGIPQGSAFSSILFILYTIDYNTN